MKYDHKRGLWTFEDAITVSTSDITTTGKKILVDDTESGLKDVLAIEMAITHSDFVNLNHRLYLGSAMKDSVESWLKPYPKPVIRTHDELQEPIGRVYAAEFRADPGIGASENMRGVDKADVLQFLESYSPGNKPSGHIYAGFYVSDRDAINKWLDGRYQTVSVGFNTKEAFCSKCGANFATMSMDEAQDHEHIPGKDDCHIIVGHKKYEHLAVVNQPADEFTYVATMKIEKQMYGDSIAPKTFIFNSTKVTSLGDEAAMPMTNLSITPTEVKIVWPAEAKLLLEDARRKQYITDTVADHSHRAILDPETKNGYTDWVLVHSHSVANDVLSTEHTYDYAAPVDEHGNYPIKLADHSHALGKEVEPLVDSADTKYVVEFVCDQATDFSENDTLEAMVAMDDDWDAIEQELVTEGELTEDAKLSTAKRKSLPDSVFCGPGRSFPVNDCAHYTAALRLLNRYKGSDSTKAKIHSCITRKGKRLGCGADSVEEAATTEPTDLDTMLAREDVKTHIDGLLGQKDAVINSLNEKLVILEAEVKELKATVELLTTEATKKDEDLTTTKSLLVTEQEAKSALTDQNVKFFKLYKLSIVDEIILRAQLSNKGPVAEALIPAAGEQLIDKIAVMRQTLSKESLETLKSKLDSVDGDPSTVQVQKLDPVDFGKGKDELATQAQTAPQPKTLDQVFST